MRRLARLLATAALAGAALVTIGGGQVASGQTGPVGYTVAGPLMNGLADCAFYSIDMSTGAMTQISDPSTEVDCADGLTFSPDGTLYAYTNQPFDGLDIDAQLVTIDLSTGAQTEIGPLPNVFATDGGMTFDAAGNLWLYANSIDPTSSECGATNSERCLWQVDPATAATTFVGTTPSNVVTGLAASCAPEVLAITTPLLGGIPSGTEIQRVDTSTAALEPVVELPDTFTPTGLDFDANGSLWALAAEPDNGFGFMEVEQVDLASGDTTHTRLTVGTDPFFGFALGLAISPISCPEPPPPPEPAPAALVLTPTFTG